jgi:hypothetical protein
MIMTAPERLGASLSSTSGGRGRVCSWVSVTARC